MSSTSQTPERFSPDSIKRVLKICRDTEALAQDDYAKLKLVEWQRQEENFPNTPSGYGNALRAVLHQAIRALKPDEEEPEHPSKAWRPYLILTERYIDGYQPKDIRKTLSIAPTTFTNAHKDALRRLGDILQEREQKCEPPPPQASVPFMAPPLPDIAIIGRDQIVADLRRRLLAGDNLALFALNGLPGVGKTALAIALAHNQKVREYFSDGVLWAGLGHQPDLMTLLSIWGVAVGIPASEMARFLTVEDRIRVINAAIGTRQMLLVIDDAWKIDHALVFKLGGLNCAHILTTRLPDLAWDFARQGAKAVQELNESDSLKLLSEFVPQLVIKQPEEARALVKAVDGLPLALILMGRYLEKGIYLGTPDVLPDLLEELQFVKNRLELTMPLSALEKQPNLPLGAPISLLASIEISDNALPDAARQVLRALSVFRPKPNTFSEEAALAVADESSEKFLKLTEAGLVESSGTARYTMHQVIADYAGFKNPSPDTHNRRASAYFAQFAQKHSKEGYKELDLDWQNIESAMQWASSNQQWHPLLEGVQGLTEANLGVMGFMDARGHWSNIRELLKGARQAAQMLNQRQAEAELLTKMGAFAFREADFQVAKEYLLKSESILKQLPDTEEIILHRTHCYEFLARLEMGHQLEAAHQWIEQGLTELDSLPITTEVVKHQKGYFYVLLATLNGRGGRFPEAITAGKRGLELLPSEPTAAKVSGLTTLGMVFYRRGEIDKTVEYVKQGIEIAEKLGDLRRLAGLLLNLGNTELDRADLRTARTNYQKALQLYQQLGDTELAGVTQTNLGIIYIILGEDEFALHYFTTALLSAEKHKLLELEALVKTNLSHLLIYQGQLAKAISALSRAEKICKNINLNFLLPVVLYWQAEIARLDREYDEAQTLIDKSLQVAQRDGYLLIEGIGWSIKGKILDAIESFSEATIAHQTSLKLLAGQNPYDLAHSKLAFGQHYMMCDGHLSEKAKSWLVEALAIFKRLGSKREINKINTLFFY